MRIRPDHAALEQIFELLLECHGPQHWWPADSHFEMITGAILTQNTAWTNVEKALNNLKAADVWSFPASLALPQDELADLIRPSGYYNQKARKLQNFAGFLDREFEGDIDLLFRLDILDLRTTLLGLWGIGEETADDIILYAAKKPSFVIDKYTIRFVDRLGWRVDGGGYGEYQRLFTSRLPADTEIFSEYHALIDRHCHTTCKKTPLCGNCCLRESCPTGRANLPGGTTPATGQA